MSVSYRNLLSAYFYSALILIECSYMARDGRVVIRLVSESDVVLNLYYGKENDK